MFVSCDWGTTHLRLRAVEATVGEIAAAVQSDDGVARLAAGDPRERPARFAEALSRGLDFLSAEVGRPLRKAACFISGMASSSIGWRELPYAGLPLAVDGSNLACQELETLAGAHGPHRVFLVSGLATSNDVLRGEETQIVGLFRLPFSRALSGNSLVILPGTHCKHATIADGQVTGFQTYMTGELYELAATHSVLNHSVGRAALRPDALRAEVRAAFRAGVEEGRARPLSAALFRVRTRQLLDGTSLETNRAFLSGLLIGAELTYLTDQAADRALVLCAAEQLSAFYSEALDALALSHQLTVIPPAEVDRLTALGHSSLALRLRLT